MDLASVAHIASQMPQLRVVSFVKSCMDSQRLRSLVFSAVQGASLSVHVCRLPSPDERLTEQECCQIAAEVSLTRGADAPTLVWRPFNNNDFGRYAANQLRVQ